MSFTRAWEPRVGDAFGFALLDYLEHGSEARSHFIERDDGLLETIDTGVLFTQGSEWSVPRRLSGIGLGSECWTWERGRGDMPSPYKSRAGRWWRWMSPRGR